MKNQLLTEADTHRQEIDLLNIFFCFCVVLIHLFSQELLRHKIIFLLQRVLFCSIYGFIFLSGFKNFYSYELKNCKKYFSSRFKKIVLPYLQAVLVYCVITGEPSGIQQFLSHLFTGSFAAHFYFVIVILQFYFLTPLFQFLSVKYSKKTVLILSLAINLLTVLLLHKWNFYTRIFSRYLFCYSIGYYAGKEYSKFTDFLEKNKKKIIVLYLIFLSLELWTSLQMAFYTFPTIIQQFTTTLYMPFSVLFLYWLSLSLTAKYSIMDCKLLKIINKNTYFIYLWHILIINLTEKYSAAAGILNFLTKGFIVGLLLTAMIAIKQLFSKNRHKK